MKIFIQIAGWIIAAIGLAYSIGQFGDALTTHAGAPLSLFNPQWLITIVAGLGLVAIGTIIDKAESIELSTEKLEQFPLRAPNGTNVIVRLRRKNFLWYPDVKGLNIPGEWISREAAIREIHNHWSLIKNSEDKK